MSKKYKNSCLLVIAFTLLTRYAFGSGDSSHATTTTSSSSHGAGETTTEEVFTTQLSCLQCHAAYPTNRFCYV